MMNFGVAVADQFKGDRERFESFMWRWKAWSQWLLSKELIRLYPNRDPIQTIGFAAEICAVCPLTTDGQVNRGIFLGALADKVSKSSS